jgi:hypothetical protein
MALPGGGVDPNTVYLGYAPASSIKLKALASGGASGFSYLWNTGATSQTITVSPVVPTTYTVTVTDDAGCNITTSRFVNVADVRCGTNKVVICKTSGSPPAQQTLCVSKSQAEDLLEHGAHLGACTGIATVSTAKGVDQRKEENIPATSLALRVFPNPSSHTFTLVVNSSDRMQKTQLTIFNAVGKVVEVRIISPNETITLGAMYRPGVYFAEVIQGKHKASIKLVKQPE